MTDTDSRPAQIWVDADACPVVVRDILFKAAERAKIQLTLVANQPIRVPPSRFIRQKQVSSGFDVADDEIVRLVARGDLVISSDIPLISEVIEKGAEAISPRGEIFTPENIRGRLNMRDFMETMRSSGIQSGGPPPLSKSDRQTFANGLDRYLARAKNR